MRRRLARDIGYGDIGQLTFGPWCFHLIQGAVWFTQYMTCISYLIFIANAVFEIYPMVPALFPLQNGSYGVEVASRASVLNPVAGVPMLNIYGVESRHPNKRSLPDFSPAFDMSPNYYFDSLTNASSAVEFFGNDSSPVTVEPPTPVVPNTTTTQPSTTPLHNTTTTPHPNTTTTPLPSPTYVMVTTAPSLKYIVLFPVAFFILTSLLRNLRSISLFSGIAAAALSIGAGSVFIYLLIGESDHNE